MEVELIGSDLDRSNSVALKIANLLETLPDIPPKMYFLNSEIYRKMKITFKIGSNLENSFWKNHGPLRLN